MKDWNRLQLNVIKEIMKFTRKKKRDNHDQIGFDLSIDTIFFGLLFLLINQNFVDGFL